MIIFCLHKTAILLLLILEIWNLSGSIHQFFRYQKDDGSLHMTTSFKAKKIPFSQNWGRCGFMLNLSASTVTNTWIQTFSSYCQGKKREKENLSKIFLFGNNIWSYFSKKRFLQQGSLLTHKQDLDQVFFFNLNSDHSNIMDCFKLNCPKANPEKFHLWSWLQIRMTVLT